MTPLTNSELDQIEAELGHPLPGLYRKLLMAEGYRRPNADVEIYHPAAVWELYEPFFDDPGQLFNPYFPFGCHHRKQEPWVIDAVTERAASIWHETVPDDWPEEEWLEYHVWVERHLDAETPPGE